MKTRILIQICALAMCLCFTTRPIAGQTCHLPKLPSQQSAQNRCDERQQMDLGDAVAEHLQNSHQVIEDEKLTSYIRRIGERLTKHLPPTNLRFQFFLF